MSKIKQQPDYQKNSKKFALERKEMNSLLSSLRDSFTNNNLTEEEIANFQNRLNNLRNLAESLSESQIKVVNEFKTEFNKLTIKLKAKESINFLEEKAELLAKIYKQWSNNEEIDYEEVSNIYREISEQTARNSEIYSLLSRNDRNRAERILNDINEYYNAIDAAQEEANGQKAPDENANSKNLEEVYQGNEKGNQSDFIPTLHDSEDYVFVPSLFKESEELFL